MQMARGQCLKGDPKVGAKGRGLLRVEGTGFRIQGLGSMVQGPGFRVQGQKSNP